jgi:signal transduction histidine kinase
MAKPLRVLIIENSPEDTKLLVQELERAGHAAIHQRVASAEAMTEALDKQGWDLVLASYNLPGFSGLAALTILKEKGIDLPFLIVSGPLGDEAAVAAMKAGAHDIIPKGNPGRLAAAVEREMRQARARKERKTVQEDHDRLLAREQSARDQAESVIRAKDKFLAAVSHELLTPLTPVLAAADLLKRSGNLSPETQHLPDVIRHNIELELRLINDLLDLTRLSSGKLDLNLTQVDVHALIEKVARTYQEDIKTKRIQLTTALSAGDHHVRGDPVRLLHVFWNLLGNAVKFTPIGGAIRISSSNPQERMVALEVSDNGTSIDPEEMDRLFRALKEGEHSLSLGEPGLSLTLSKEVIDLHGGTLRIESGGKGKGSTFTVELDTLPAAERAVGDASMTQKPLTILLVENNEDTLWTLARLLRGYGHQVLTASSANDALAAAASNKFDILISDIGLPDRSGWELMRQLKAKAPVRGIALSGFGSDEDAQKSLVSGFSAHLTKPVNAQKLEELIHQMVG